jgi:LPXTG-motif cell wall-anchored protein
VQKPPGDTLKKAGWVAAAGGAVALAAGLGFLALRKRRKS